MSADVGTAGRQEVVRVRRRNLVVAAVALVVLLALAALAGRPASTAPYDPTSVAPSGLRGVVELLQDMGSEIAISTNLLDDASMYDSDDAPTRIFVPVDAIGAERREAILAWVHAGGTLVVAGEAQLHDLAPGGTSLGSLVMASARAPACDAPALADVGAVVAPSWPSLGAPEGPASVCFGEDGEPDRGWLVAFGHGEGTVVALASADPLTNRWLDHEDNAVLAAALLAPSHTDRVVVVPTLELGEGDVSLLSLLPRGVWRALVLAAVALLVAALWRSRRLGPPVAERLPPVLPSVELARSVAGLLQRAGDRTTAAAHLRAQALDDVRSSLGVGGGIEEAAAVAALAAQRTGLDPDLAQRALVSTPVPDDAALLAVADAAARLRAALRTPAPRAASDTSRPIEPSMSP